MNEAIVTFVLPEVQDKVLVPYTKVIRVEFQGTAEDFLLALQGSQSSELRIVSMETLTAR